MQHGCCNHLVAAVFTIVMAASNSSTHSIVVATHVLSLIVWHSYSIARSLQHTLRTPSAHDNGEHYYYSDTRV